VTRKEAVLNPFVGDDPTQIQKSHEIDMENTLSL
jgi:hypothetical protein